MSKAFFPPARIVASLDTRGAITLRELLERAGAPCRASGRWTERPVVLVPGSADIEREPGDWGAVRIGVPSRMAPRAAAPATSRAMARHACLAMAYGLMDIVARESLRGLPWAKPAAPRGRPRSGTTMTNAQRQAAYRARHRRPVASGASDATSLARA
jgi:hypothetical protein